MYKPAIARQKPTARPTRSECCTDAECSSGLRNQYFVGKRLTPDAFHVEQRYLIERRHLINRALFGWGVVYGFPVTPAAPAPYEASAVSGRLRIGEGLALDRPGRELVQCGSIELAVADAIVLQETKGRTLPAPNPPGDAVKKCWLLSVHYAEQDMGPVTISDPCSCERHEWDHVCETVRYSLREVECCDCCKEHECELCCECATGPCCEEESARAEERPSRQRGGARERGGCRCLCDYLTRLDLEPDCRNLCEIQEPCARVRVDLHHGVPLACVRLCRDDCNDWMFDTWIEACGPRRLVKRNDLLFDLIRGCDVTRISAIGWEPWHRKREPVHWRDFVDSFGQEGPPGHNVTEKYWVEFSRPVRRETLQPDAFSMTILVPEGEGGWLHPLRVPVIGVEAHGGPDAPKGCVTRAKLVVDAGWVSDALKGRKSLFTDDETWVEITVEGDYLIDCNGQRVAAAADGLSPCPTGNGTPGGRFVSKFPVAPREATLEQKPDDKKHHAQGAQP